ncbi:hypothetical protein Tco_0267572 [Tanacetum coccineum]
MAKILSKETRPRKGMINGVVTRDAIMVAAALSDEELALLLHQELDSSPRVPRVPRMRNAGSLPQLHSITSTSHLGTNAQCCASLP